MAAKAGHSPVRRFRQHQRNRITLSPICPSYSITWSARSSIDRGAARRRAPGPKWIAVGNANLWVAIIFFTDHYCIHVDCAIRTAHRSLLNHAVGANKNRLGHCHAQRLRGL